MPNTKQPNKNKNRKKSYGKEFERQVFKNFSEVEGVSIDRIPDQVTRYKNTSSNICDFIVYKKPTLLYLECKSVHGNTLSIYSVPKKGKDGKLHGFYGNIRDNQWEGLLEKSQIEGVRAGILIWFVDKDVTIYLSISALEYARQCGDKSIRFDTDRFDLFSDDTIIHIPAKKKRTMFEYDFSEFFNTI